MTEEFTASNGVKIRIGASGHIEYFSKNNPIPMWRRVGSGFEGTPGGFAASSIVGNAIREYYRHQEDLSLERFRSKANADFLVYEIAGAPDSVRIVNERTGFMTSVLKRSPSVQWEGIVAEYLETLAKPWDDAQDDDVWELTLSDGTRGLYIYGGGEFRNGKGGRLIQSYITEAKLVYRKENE